MRHGPRPTNLALSKYFEMKRTWEDSSEACTMLCKWSQDSRARLPTAEPIWYPTGHQTLLLQPTSMVSVLPNFLLLVSVAFFFKKSLLLKLIIFGLIQFVYIFPTHDVLLCIYAYILWLCKYCEMAQENGFSCLLSHISTSFVRGTFKM